ncbi:glucokinase [Novosphingobium album (ex Hu et al. 2023)]|uniref:Glucokinase n=1 Tax=Novosphingobium album (ex Hu et al. 2023) TaxID=2930093 RepID=A0ABT0B297_9SPHN|nr:glucokinase [Novosphingobium album (ex Hu et al. 2023)]MCJ2179182.1 glucokinase [Novosphingobium album (ex Hu et al. 2023)]
MTDLVAVDIGGTHARFALASVAPDGTITLGEPATLHTRDHGSFQLAWQAFQHMNGGTLPPAVAMSVAGPVGGEIIKFTNNPWIIRPALIAEKLGATRHTIVNDFAAVAHAVARAPESEFVDLAGPPGTPLPSSGTISVLGPGTGLGVAHLWRDGKGSYHVQATEGGHIDFAPLDLIDDAILARLRKRHTRVSVERVVSGPAIVDIYATLAAMEHKAIVEKSDVEIWTAGTSGEDPLAAAAVDRFCLSLGAAAGDYALAHGASGVVIAGGLGYRIRETILKSGFSDRFCAKGRFAGMMATLPVKLITHPQPGLFGAAAAFAREHLPK